MVPLYGQGHSHWGLLLINLQVPPFMHCKSHVPCRRDQNRNSNLISNIIEKKITSTCLTKLTSIAGRTITRIGTSVLDGNTLSIIQTRI